MWIERSAAAMKSKFRVSLLRTLGDFSLDKQRKVTCRRPPVRTVGSYWPYATTLFDYVRRAMPIANPLSLSDDEVYAVSAYVLFLNGIVGEDAQMNAEIRSISGRTTLGLCLCRIFCPVSGAFPP